VLITDRFDRKGRTGNQQLREETHLKSAHYVHIVELAAAIQSAKPTLLGSPRLSPEGSQLVVSELSKCLILCEQGIDVRVAPEARDELSEEPVSGSESVGYVE